MVKLINLPESILLQVIPHLNLHELQQLAQTCGQLRELVYTSPSAWHQHVFPPKDARITDRFVRHFVPNISRHHGIRTIRLEQLPLGWLGYLIIFDQFAHSVDCIHVETSYAILQALVHHLTVFATNLTVLQQDNHIPITFREYGLNPTCYYQVLVDHQFLGKPSLAHLTQAINNSNNNIKKNHRDGDISCFPILDDPPFENLQHWTAICTDHPQDQDDAGRMRNCLSQLESLISFLAGRQVTRPGITTTTNSPVSPITTSTTTTTTTSIAGYKRTQDHLDTSNRQKQRLVSSASHNSSLYV